MYKKKLPHMREANVLKVVVVVLSYYNPDMDTVHYENFSIFMFTNLYFFLTENELQS
jgi:hypothetical protein